MGLERFIGFLTRNLSYNCLEELDINNSLKKILCNHIFFDLNFIIYYCLLELEDEVNDILKLIFSLQFNKLEHIESLLKNCLNKKYWEKVNINFRDILDGNNEINIVNNFKNYLNSKSNNNYPIIFKVLYWKIYYKIINWISNFHELKYLKSLNIFLDGIPSFSKILEQRRRRSKNYLESELRRKNFKKYFDNIDNDIVKDNNYNYNYFNWLDNKFSINKSIGPTSELTINLEIFLLNKLRLNYDFEVTINNGRNNGESDMKIFKYIHENNIKDAVVIHTCDSDLIHQIITQQSYFNINQVNIDLNVIRYYTKVRNGAQIISAKKIINMILKKYNELSKNKHDDNFNYLVVLDLMFIIYSFGNDIFPSSLEIGYELSLNYLINSHINGLKDSNVINIENNKMKLNLNKLSLWLKKIKDMDTFTIIILNRFYKLPYNLINFLVEKLNIKLENLVDDFLIPFYIYEGYNNIVIENNVLEEEDLRFKYFMKFKKKNKDKIPKNPLDTNIIPENYKKQYILMKESLLKFIDFYSEENHGLQRNSRIQMIEENSYQDLYRYVCKTSEEESIKKYRNFYKPYSYEKTCLQDYRKLLINNDSDVEEYLIKLYYCVNIFFNDMSNYNPCNFLSYNRLKCPSIDSIIEFIDKSNLSTLYKKWNTNIKNFQVDKKKYFDSIAHHIFITPYLRTSEYINKLDNVKKLKIILNELSLVQNNLWFDKDKNENFNYRKIDPILFLNNWNNVLKKVNLKFDDNMNVLNSDEFSIIDDVKISDYD
jgi:hypothetical protein